MFRGDEATEVAKEGKVTPGLGEPGQRDWRYSSGPPETRGVLRMLFAQNPSLMARGARKAYWNRRAQRYMSTPFEGAWAVTGWPFAEGLLAGKGEACYDILLQSPG